MPKTPVIIPSIVDLESERLLFFVNPKSCQEYTQIAAENRIKNNISIINLLLVNEKKLNTVMFGL